MHFDEELLVHLITAGRYKGMQLYWFHSLVNINLKSVANVLILSMSVNIFSTICICSPDHIYGHGDQHVATADQRWADKFAAEHFYPSRTFH